MPVRELTAHRASVLNDQIRVFALDEPGPGGACHDYVTLIPTGPKRPITGDAPFDMEEMEKFVIPHADDLGLDELYIFAGNALLISSGIVQNFSVQRIKFQNGPVNEVGGANGNTHEAQIAIILDRLAGFQAGQFAGRENAMAATKLDEALLWLKKRTWDRIARGVEGTMKK